MEPLSEEERVVVMEMMEPLINALPSDKQVEARSIIRREARGVFAWAVQSGYLLWSRQHPGEVPTMVQIAEWSLAEKGPF